MRRDLASALRSAHPRPGAAAAGQAARRAATGPATHADDEIGRLRDRAARRTRATTAPTARTTPAGPSASSSSTATPQTLRRRVEQRTNTVARQFDRVCEVLTALDYLEGDTVTDRGRHLMRLYSEHGPGRRRVACAPGSGTTSSPSGLAAALSVLVFEARRPDDASSPRLPGGARPRGHRRDGAGSGARSTRSSATTSSTSCASPTSASPGSPTAGPRATTSTTCSSVSDLAAGDFVRWMKQLHRPGRPGGRRRRRRAAAGDRARGGPRRCAAGGGLLGARRRRGVRPASADRVGDAAYSPLTRFHCCPIGARRRRARRRPRRPRRRG